MSEALEGLHVDERRLAAILAADVAGYSRLMGRNEEETVRELEAHQAAILPLIARHGGSIVNIAGDGVVAQFPSAVRAVECAVAMQKIMAERNFDVPADRRMLLRIGVNLGDIIHDGTRTYGDGINVAARLEPLAEPGGICISAAVRDAIFGKLGLPLRDIGEKTLKNIDRPVHIYQIQAPGTRARRDWLSAGLRHYRRLAPALGLVVLLAAVAGVAAWRFWPRATPEFDGMPTVAVLPFSAAAEEPAQAEFAGDVTREVAARLSTFPGAHTLALSKAATNTTPKEAAQATGATYALEGDVAAAGGKSRVAARLTDAGTGEGLWSAQYDFEGSDRLAMQADVARNIYAALGGFFGKIMKLEIEKAWRKPDGELTEYDYYHRARSYLAPGTRESLARAREVAEQGLARFPGSPALNLVIASAYSNEQTDIGPFPDCHEKFALAWSRVSEADKAKNKSRFLTFQEHFLLAKLYALHAGDFDRSVEEAKAVVEMAPNEPIIRSAMATFLSQAGRLDEGVEWASVALRQEHSATFARWLKPNLGWSLYLAGRNGEAWEAIKDDVMVEPDVAAAILVRLGREDEARAIIADWRKIGSFSIASASCWPIKEPMKSMYLDDVRKAGLPEK